MAKRTIIDDNADGYQYIGEAEKQAVTAAAAWTITRISSANPKTIDTSDSNVVFDDRTTLEYS